MRMRVREIVRSDAIAKSRKSALIRELLVVRSLDMAGKIDLLAGKKVHTNRNCLAANESRKKYFIRARPHSLTLSFVLLLHN